MSWRTRNSSVLLKFPAGPEGSRRQSRYRDGRRKRLEQIIQGLIKSLIKSDMMLGKTESKRRREPQRMMVRQRSIDSNGYESEQTLTVEDRRALSGLRVHRGPKELGLNNKVCPYWSYLSFQDLTK